MLEFLSADLSEKYSILTAKDGSEAIGILSEEAVNLVISDVMMPVMDGYEMLRILRNDEVLKDIPVIAVTAKAMKGDDKRCMEAGASDYIPKPIDLKNLMSKMAKWL